MSYKIGIPTILELPDIDSTISFCREMKLNLIEIGMTRPNFFPSSISPDKLRSASQEHGIEFTIHLPEEFDLATFHESIRNSFVSWIIECLEWAKDAGISIATMHLSNGIYYTLPTEKRWLYNELRSEYIENITDSFRKIHEVSETNGQVVCIENCNNFHLPFIKETIENLSPFMLTWDVGHDAHSGYRETEHILARADRVAHMHLHDYSEMCPHKELFTGTVDIDEMIKFAKEKDIRVIVEVKNVESIKNSIQKLRDKDIL